MASDQHSLSASEPTHGTSISSGLTAWLAVAVVPVVFILPLLLPGAGARYGVRRLVELAWAAAILLLLHPRFRRLSGGRWREFGQGTRWAVLGLMAWAGSSVMLSSAPQYAFREWALYVLLGVAILPLSVAIGGRTREVTYALAVTLLLYGVIAVVSGGEHGFAHPRFQGQALAVSIPAVLFAQQPVLALYAAPSIAAGVLAGSRALVLALAVAFGAAALWPGEKMRMSPALVSLGFAALIVVVSTLLGHGSDMASAIGRGTSSTGRVGLWLETVDLWSQSPWFGVGPGLLGANGGLRGWAAHPHNVVLTILGETGIVGLGLAAFLAVRGLRALLAMEPAQRPWALAVVSTGVHAMFSGTLIMPASQTLVTLLMAVLIGSQAVAPGTSGQDASDRHFGRALLLLGVTALVILFSTLALPGGRPAGELLGPRFWINGIVP